MFPPPLRPPRTIVDPLRDLASFARQLLPGDRNYRYSRDDLPVVYVDASSRDCDYDYGDDLDAPSPVVAFDLLTYNVNHATATDARATRNVLDAILHSRADVVLLQETNTRWEAILTNDVSISSRYEHVHFHHPGECGTDERRRGGGMAILSRYPMMCDDDHDGDDVASLLDMSRDVRGSVFPALVCVIYVPMMADDDDASTTMTTPPRDDDVPSRRRTRRRTRTSRSATTFPLRIANVHLRPPLELDGTCKLSTGRTTGRVRLGEAMELLRRGAAVPPLLPSVRRGPNDADADASRRLRNDRTRRRRLDVIAGDFNEGDRDDGGGGATALSYLADRGYANALREYVPRRKETHLWPFITFGVWGEHTFRLFLRKRLDHVLWHRDAWMEDYEDDEDDMNAASAAEKRHRSTSLRCVGCGVITGYETGASDHQPVLSRFVIRQSSPG